MKESSKESTGSQLISLWSRINAFFLPSTDFPDRCEFKDNTVHGGITLTLGPGQSIRIGGEKYTQPLISDERVKEVNERFLRERGYE